MTTLTVRPSTVFPHADDRTATEPAEYRGLARDQVRLLAATPRGTSHHRFRELPEQLSPGDLLIVNNSQTVAGEIDAVAGADSIVLHVATELAGGSWVVELRSAPDAAHPILDARVGEHINVPGWGRLELRSPYPRAGSSPSGVGSRLWAAVAEPDPDARPLTEHLRRWGRPIAYGYLSGRFPLSAYQTVFGRVPGSAEMPSAARPFTDALTTRLVSRGVRVAPITLHTGVSSQDAGEAPQPERFRVPAATAALVNATRASGGRIVAVGTTATRAIESAVCADGHLEPAKGWTDRIITPEHPARVVDGLITGWHNPDASHLLLVESVAGPELTQRVYEEAVRERYRWHEFGDSGLLLSR